MSSSRPEPRPEPAPEPALEPEAAQAPATLSSLPPPNASARAIGKRPRMSRFRRILLAITATAHLPFVVAVAEGLQRLGVSPALAWIVGGVLGAAGILLFDGRANHTAEDWHRPWWQTFLVDLPYYWHWCTCVFCIVPSILYLALEPLVDLARGAPVGPSPGFFMWTYATGLIVCGYGCTLRRWFFVSRRVEIPIRGLDPKLDGYVIAQLSDLHIGAQTPLWWGRRWARVTNAAAPDAVVVTGDMVTSGVAFHEDIATLIGELKGKDGTFVIMGNHDYFGEGEPLVTLLRGRGAHVLRNEGVMLERDGARLFLAGMDDTWTKRANLEASLAERREGVPTVLLAHDPDRFPHAVRHKVELVLSGHTHGGQIAMPFLGRFINASKLAHRFHIGLYEEGDSTLYVHPGLGTTGPPMRIGVAPVIAFITLRAA